MRHAILLTILGFDPKMKGNDEANEVADWVAGNANSRILFLDTQRQSGFGRGSMSRLEANLRIIESKCTLDLVIGCFFPHL